MRDLILNNYECVFEPGSQEIGTINNYNGTKEKQDGTDTNDEHRCDTKEADEAEPIKEFGKNVGSGTAANLPSALLLKLIGLG